MGIDAIKRGKNTGEKGELLDSILELAIRRGGLKLE